MKSLRQYLDFRKEISLLVGDGLPRQLGFDTSTLNLIESMHAISKRYGRFVKMVKDNDKMEFEQLLLLIMNEVDRRGFRYDFSLAVCGLITPTQTVIDAATSWFSKFDNIFSLNFDPLMVDIYNRLVEYDLAVAAIFHDETLTRGQKECELQLLNLTANFCRLRVAEGHRPLIKHDLFICDALARSESERHRTNSHDMASTTIRKPFDDGFEDDLWDASSKRVLTQNFTYLHGAFHLYVKLLSWLVYKLRQIDVSTITRLQRNLGGLGKQLFILCAKHAEKMNEINNNDYLRAGMRKLREARGILIVYGVNIYKETDRHLWEAVAENEGIKEVYISTNDPEAKLPDWLEPLLAGKKVGFYDRELNLLPQD